MGTPAYISPEQAEGTTATSASDVYSLAVVAFECLAGRKPFVADTPVGTAIAHLRNPVPDLPDTVPADLAAVVRRGMAKSPGERFPDGAAFARALRSPSSVAGVGAATAVAPARPRRAARRARGEHDAGHTGGRTCPHPRPDAGPRAGARPPSYDAVAAAHRHRGRAGRRAARRLAGHPRRRAHRFDGRQHPLEGQSQSSSEAPSQSPSQSPSKTPSDTPTETPTESPSETPSETPTETPTETEPATVEVDPAAYVGRDRKDVEKELRDLGLEPVAVELDNPGDQPDGIVDSVEPSGTLQEGDQVTVSFWGKTPPGQQKDEGNDQG